MFRKHDPTHVPSRQSALSAGLLATALLLSACQEEQILYRAESPTPIPPVPERPESPRTDFAAVHTGGTGAAAFELPAPEPTTFDAEAPNEPFRSVALEGVQARVPLRYRQTPSPSDMRLVQYDVPAPEETALPEGEFVVFHFGEGQGGGVRDNVMRWAGQFQPAPGAETPVTRYVQGRVDGLTVTRLTLEGQYVPAGMGADLPGPAPQDRWAMEALVVEGGPRGNLYLRLTGPAELVQAESHVIAHVAASLERDGAARPEEHAHTEPAPEPPEGESGVSLVQAPGVAFAIPASWDPVPTGGGMRALEFAVPGPGGTGELAVFYFGRDGGGTAQGNIDRWISQVTQPGGGSSRDHARVQQRTVGRFSVTTVTVEGTYRATPMGPQAPAPEPLEDHGLFGAVIEGGAEGSIFVRLTGPVETVRANEDVMNALVASLQEP